MTSYQESDAASRQDASQGALGCLIPLIAATVVLAIAVTLVSWLVIDDDEAPQPDDENAVVERATGDRDDSDLVRSAPEILDDLSPRGNEGVSSQALWEVVQSGGWSEFGTAQVIDLDSQQRVTRKFRLDDEHLQVTIHSYKSANGPKTVLEETELPARALQFDNKIVVIEPLTDGAKPRVDKLAERLRKFRELLDEQDGEP